MVVVIRSNELLLLTKRGKPWQESIISSKNRCVIPYADFQQRQEAKQCYYTEIVSNRDLDSLASGRRLCRASKTYNHLVVK